MNRRGVRLNRLDVSEINSHGDGAGSFSRALLSELNETFAIEFREPEAPKSSLEEGEARGLRPPDALADFLEVFAMDPNEIAECPRLAAAD